MRTSFLLSEAEDEELESTNEVFWAALLDRVRADGFDAAPHVVVDVGSHRGGLLERVADRWRPSALIGVEPLAGARKRAQLRLKRHAPRVEMLDVTEWSRVASAEVDLLLCFEVLHVVPDLDAFFQQVARVLSPRGRGYIVLGCHAENPAWARWSAELAALGHQVAHHHPMAIMQAGAARGLLPSVRPLRDSGWVTYDPRETAFGFESVGEMLAHHFCHKLLFLFRRPSR